MARCYLDEQDHWRDERAARVAGTVMLFGKHKGETFRAIAADDAGLLYLDWLIGQKWLSASFRARLKTFLDQPDLVRRLGDLLESKDG
jgi:hypothetical protein